LIAILDYGSGNLRSAERAFATAGKEVVVTSDRTVALEADGLVVPGVGAFAACMKGLKAVDGAAIVRERLAKERPTLGICIGMQIMLAKVQNTLKLEHMKGSEFGKAQFQS
jgi:glutamine amidotransferase